MVVRPQSADPVAYWRPFEGERHGMAATRLPRLGQEREALCGRLITIVDPSVVDWLAPTCSECWGRATRIRDKRS